MQRRKQMEYVVIAFRSRAHTIKVANYLRVNGIKNEIVNTPKEAGVGCGLSVKISKNAYSAIKRAVLAMNLSSYAGFFLVSIYGAKRTVRSI